MKKILLASLAILLLFSTPVYADFMLNPQEDTNAPDGIETTVWINIDNIFSQQINYAIARFTNKTGQDISLDVTTYYADDEGNIFGYGVSECLYLASEESFWDVISLGGETFGTFQFEYGYDAPSQSMKEAYQVSSLDITQNTNGSVEYTAKWDSNHGMRIYLFYLDSFDNPKGYYTVGIYGESPSYDYVDSPPYDYKTCLGTFYLE